MPFPVNLLDKSQEATSVIQVLKNLDSKAAKAQGLGNHDVLNLYFTAIKTAAKFDDLSLAGFPIEVLGPEIGSQLNIDWTAHEAEFVTLKNTHLPTFVSLVILNQGEICAQHIDNLSVEYLTMSDTLKAELLPLITNIKNMFEA